MPVYSFEGRIPRIDREAFVAPAATLIGDVVVIGGTQIPDDVVVAGAPAEIRGPVAGTGAENWVRTSAGIYQNLAQRYRDGLQQLD
ncbi:hypothetical protein ACWDUN_10310 [Mycobacterium sp. NPDC003323]